MRTIIHYLSKAGPLILNYWLCPYHLLPVYGSYINSYHILRKLSVQYEHCFRKTNNHVLVNNVFKNERWQVLDLILVVTCDKIYDEVFFFRPSGSSFITVDDLICY